MKTLLEVLKLATAHLQQKGIQNPRRQAEDLISDALDVSRIILYLEFERPLTDPELSRLRERLARRAKGEPLQYINGKLNFFDCDIHVTPDVLIPRQETEILVDKIANSLSKHDLNGKVLWDICCGSGCIGIALKKRFPQLKVTLSDISSAALDVARKNAEVNGVEVNFVEGDMLVPFIGQEAHFLVCNPPYIAEHEFAKLDIEVRNHEPRLALIGGKSGLEFYERLAQDLKKVLVSNASVWFEMGSGQGSQLTQLFQGLPWRTCRVEQDWAGHDRFFFLEFE